jgi:fumarate hydratase class II
MSSDPDAVRIERDSMGEMPVPKAALYGPQTARAVENFPISRLRMQRSFIRALALIKSCAARVNGDWGHLEPAKAAAIVSAAEDVAAGKYDGHFVVDVFQTGSGTSTNMNVNEVIAHLAGAHLKGSHSSVHPNDDVNRGMSSNDAIPSAIHIAAAQGVLDELLPALRLLHAALDGKAREFHGTIKTGRTHLQDAVPMRLGQEFSGYARQIELAAERIESAMPGIYELPLGGTAVGTGLNAPEGFAAAVIEEISRRTGHAFLEAENHFEAQASKDAVAFLSAALRNCAIALTKIANDVRWLGSGPRCGFGELKIPEVQPGSSIMPGKVNPVIAESLLMVCALR